MTDKLTKKFISDVDFNISTIRNRINKKYKNMYSPFSKIKEQQHMDLESNMLSLYYLFDSYLNKDIGSAVLDLNILRDSRALGLHLDRICNLKTINIINTRNDTHATVFYKFNINDIFYIYYSNSGLGIDNHICINNNVCPKIFYTKNKLISCKNIETLKEIDKRCELGIFKKTSEN